MDRNECARLVSLVRAAWPAQRFDDDAHTTVNVWGMALADVPFDEAHAALTTLMRRGQQWCSPGDVRREVARARNVLAPSADALLRDVLDVAAEEGAGRSVLHPIARRTYDAHGGQLAIRTMNAAGHATLRRELAAAIEEHDASTLEHEMPAARAAHVPVAIAREDPERMLAETRERIDAWKAIEQ